MRPYDITKGRNGLVMRVYLWLLIFPFFLVPAANAYEYIYSTSSSASNFSKIKMTSSVEQPWLYKSNFTFTLDTFIAGEKRKSIQFQCVGRHCTSNEKIGKTKHTQLAYFLTDYSLDLYTQAKFGGIRGVYYLVDEGSEPIPCDDNYRSSIQFESPVGIIYVKKSLDNNGKKILQYAACKGAIVDKIFGPGADGITRSKNERTYTLNGYIGSFDKIFAFSRSNSRYIAVLWGIDNSPGGVRLVRGTTVASTLIVFSLVGHGGYVSSVKTVKLPHQNQVKSIEYVREADQGIVIRVFYNDISPRVFELKRARDEFYIGYGAASNSVDVIDLYEN